DAGGGSSGCRAGPRSSSIRGSAPPSPMPPAARPARPSQDEASCQSLRGIVPGRGRRARPACFFRGPGRRAVGPDVRAVDVEDAPVDPPVLVQADVQTLQDPVEEALAGPPA